MVLALVAEMQHIVGQRLSLSARNHPAGDLALSPVHPKLSQVEDLLGERGIAVSYETVRRYLNHFGPIIAADCLSSELLGQSAA
jgi:hypothetical protein